MMEPFYRFRNAFWGLWYGVLHMVPFFAVRRGALLVPEDLIQSGNVKHGVRRIPLKWE